MMESQLEKALRTILQEPELLNGYLIQQAANMETEPANLLLFYEVYPLPDETIRKVDYELLKRLLRCSTTTFDVPEQCHETRYDPQEHCINVRPTRSEEQLFRELLREIIFSELDDGSQPFRRAMVQLPAYCIAVLFCRAVGVRWTEDRTVNLPLWMRSYPPETLLEVLNQAQKIAEELLARFEEGERL